jgi:N-acyl-D-amino-acid deacylase
VVAVAAAVRRAVPLLEKASAGSAAARQCFTCHSQAMPVLALTAARRHGFEIDEANLTRQLDHTADHLRRGRDAYLAGRGQGGKVLTAGYALWALEAGGRKPDDATAAVAEFLLTYQQDQNRWRHTGRRPPSSGSDFTATSVALRGLGAFATDEQADRHQARTETVRGWLASAEPKDTEDRVFHLRSLKTIAAPQETIQAAARELLASQREDGGWAQTAPMQSDAYATGSALATLLDTGHIQPDAPPARKAVQFLLNSQLPDGSWHVVTRAEGFQTYYESGFPHNEDQFISTAASSWATLALLKTLSPPK